MNTQTPLIFFRCHFRYFPATPAVYHHSVKYTTYMSVWIVIYIACIACSLTLQVAWHGCVCDCIGRFVVQRKIQSTSMMPQLFCSCMNLWKVHTLYYSEGPLGIIIPDPFWWVFYGFPVVQPLSHTYPFQT